MAIGKNLGADAGFPVTVGGKTLHLGAVVLVDETGAAVSAAGGGLTNTELRATPVPVSGTVAVTGSATSAKQDTQITAEQAILAKLSADPATQTTLAAILAKIIAAPATEASLAALLAKVIAAPSTETKQDTGNTSLASILTSVDGLEAVLGTTAGAAVITDANGTAQQYLRGLIVLHLLQNTYLDGVEGSLTTLAGTLPMSNAQFLANLRSTATASSVASAATSTSILASNVNRKGARILNSDANALYLNLAGAAAVILTASHVKLAEGESFDVPAGYTGEIRGIWAADGSGAANVVEFA